MVFARVAGAVVAEKRSPSLGELRCLLVEDADEGAGRRGNYLVAADLVGANRGDLVLLAQGSSCRWHADVEDRPVDAVIVAIVDEVGTAGGFRYTAANAMVTEAGR